MGQNFSSEPVVEKDTERAENETFKAAVSSCQGWRLSQEDNHSLMLEIPESEHKASFFAVYDGHGSARVSKHASERLWCHLTSKQSYEAGRFKEALEKAFLSFDKEVNESYNAQLAGTTCICVLIVDNVIYCANIGDSRAVASINCECEPLSHDHKPDNPEELKRILAAGGYVFGNRVNGNLALSRAFGDFHYKSNDSLAPEDQIVSPKPDIKRIELNEDVDFIVLACDGIWDVLTNEEVVNFVISRLEQNMEPGLICEQLTTRCLATDYELVIGCDNMTVLLVCHTRGRSWTDYCTDVFNKNTKRLGVPRERSFNPADLEDDTDVHRRRQQMREQSLRIEADAEEEEEKRAREALMQAPGGCGGISSSDDFASHIPRDIRMLLEALQDLDPDHTGIDSSEFTNSIVPADDDSKNDQNSSNSSSGGSIQNSSVTTDENDTNVERANEISCKTTEIHLDAPENSESQKQEEKTNENPQASTTVSGTTEIELSAPDDAPDLSEVPDPIVDNREELEVDSNDDLATTVDHNGEQDQQREENNLDTSTGGSGEDAANDE